MSDLAFEDVVIVEVAMALAFGLVKFDSDPVATGLALYLADELYHSLFALVLVRDQLYAITQSEPRQLRHVIGILLI